MNYMVQRIRQLTVGPKGISAGGAVRQALLRLREAANRLTGGGLHSSAKRQLGRLRDAGDRLTGGGLRALAKRVLAVPLRRGMGLRPLRVLGRGMLRPFPNLSTCLYRQATASDAVTKGATSSPRFTEHLLFVKSLYRTAFGRHPDETELMNWLGKLPTRTYREVLAQHFVRSAEFQNRHGPSQEVDINYITALYRDGLGRPPQLDCLAFWLLQGENGATRAKVLAGVAGSDEALQRVLLSKPQYGTEYSSWVAAYDTIDNTDRTVIRAHIATLPSHPLISVIMPIGRTSEVALRRSLNSVVTQLYPYWELCIAVDYLAEPLVKPIIHSPTARDPRIRFVRPDSLLRTEAATNAALAEANGEYVAFVRAGDVLPEHALYAVFVAILGNSSVDILYTDHDEMDASGVRSNPWFKPGWDPDLLLAQDYLNHLTIYRRSFLKEVGLLRPELEGAEFYDLALRATGTTTPERICHVPAILYHKGNSNNPNQRNDSGDHVDAARRAARNYLDSRGHTGVAVESAPLMPNANRIVWPLPRTLPLVSVIIPTRDRAELLAQCTEGILNRTDYMNLEVLVVDNGSVEPATLALLDRLVGADKRVRVLHYPGPFNYSALNNAAVREAKGEILLLLNNDIDVIEAGWLRELVSHAIRPDVGIVGAKLLYANQQVQHGGIVLGPHGHAAHVHRLADRNDPGYFGQLSLTRTLSAVTAACSAIRRAVFFEVGEFDEINLPISFNDVDLCLRLGDYGYRVVWTPFAELFHLESASRGKEDANPATRERFLREWAYLRKTWDSLLESGDPFHNPNLLFHPDYFEMPSSPRREKPWRPVFEQFFALRRHFSSGAVSASSAQKGLNPIPENLGTHGSAGSAGS
jgi:glycosyltransferase involved in cell wall biosynthesis